MEAEHPRWGEKQLQKLLGKDQASVREQREDWKAHSVWKEE